jgi:hypothetical protein
VIARGGSAGANLTPRPAGKAPQIRDSRRPVQPPKRIKARLSASKAMFVLNRPAAPDSVPLPAMPFLQMRSAPVGREPFMGHTGGPVYAFAPISDASHGDVFAR